MVQPLDVVLTARERAQLKRSTRAIVTRLVSQSPEHQSVLNRGENGALRVLGSLPALFAGGLLAFALYLSRDTLASIGGLAFLSDLAGRSVAAAIFGLLFLFFNPFASWLDNNLLQAWTGWYIERRKWSQGKEAANILDAVENLIRTRPEQVSGSLDAVPNERDLTHGMPQRVCTAIEGFPGPARPPAIIIRKFMERRLKSHYLQNWFESPRVDERKYRLKYFLRARAVRNAVRTQLLFDRMGAELRAEVPGNTDWQRQHYTDPGAQESTLFDTRDLHQRFRTAAPHYRWPVASSRDAVGETAVFRIIAALENPIRQPVYVITVAEVIEMLPLVILDFLQRDEANVAEDDPRINQRVAQTLDILTTIDVTMFGKWDKRTLRPASEVNIVPQPILRNVAPEGASPDWVIRWDPNRIAWGQFDESDGEARRAFAVLVAAIERAGKNAVPIVLTRGDTLLLDNLRCLVARHEVTPAQITKTKRRLLYPQSWWLRGYYGFRVPPDGRGSGGMDGASTLYTGAAPEERDDAPADPAPQTLFMPRLPRRMRPPVN